MRMVPEINNSINKLSELNKLKMNTWNIAIKHIWLKYSTFTCQENYPLCLCFHWEIFLGVGATKAFQKQWEQ